MEPVAAKTLEVEASEAAEKSEDEFNFRKMETMIHRFPPGLGEIIRSRYSYMVVPRFVAIGPYHRGKTKEFEKVEAVKKAAAHVLWQRSRQLEQAVTKAAAHYKHSEKERQRLAPDLDDATQEVVAAVGAARGMYETQGMMKDDDAQFASMMLCDACFLLLYMDAYNRSYGEEEDYEVDPSMRRFLFSNRDRINNDIMLLENQLPWQVIQVLMRLGSDLKLKEAVGYFIAAMGSSFMIRESSELQPFVWDDEKNPPPHLLALLRRHKTQEQPDKMIHHSASAEPAGGSSSTSISVDVLSDDDDVENNNNNNHLPPPSNPNPLHQPLIHQKAAATPTPPSQEAVVVVSAMSPMDLEQIGIKLTANTTAKFSDMGLEKGWFFSRVKLAPLTLGDTRASWLVNMAAFEVCTASRFGDPPGSTAVCSYLALLAFFMDGSEDVRKLRSMGLLHGPDGDDDMLAFFHTMKRHLPDYGTHFAKVMAGIEEYKQKRRIMTTLYRWVYNNWKTVTVSTVVSIILAVVSAIAALIGLYQALLSLIHNN